MSNMKVRLAGKKSFKIKIREHEVETDLPLEMGGDDKAPTPPELFVSALGACMGIYALSYMRTAKLDAEGLSLDLNWEYDKSRKRIEKIDAVISVPNADLGERKEALISAAEKCLLHNTLHEKPEMTTRIEEK